MNYELAPNYSNRNGATISDLIDALGNSDLPAPDGRQIAAIVYEDELPAVKVGEGRNLSVDNPGTGGHGYWLDDSDPDLLRRIGRSGMLASEAIARHIEARDTAAKEQERAEEERVRRLAEELVTVARNEEGIESAWGAMSPARQNGWLAVARHVLAGEEAGR
ncbi:hypothetical protein [Jiangella anatolica]|uniref:Uncharacterized protein n=1 Tax=Jiangella anatolica TaxID=2670374 RepID=A0A2W2CET7_9ACTN|nr:hypothetical protein [Jiangella anatolica]PZF84176.1 hypothetical protein C1I92_10015 [Jiangella anatolica]